jgi:hypothetical protein
VPLDYKDHSSGDEGEGSTDSDEPLSHQKTNYPPALAVKAAVKAKSKGRELSMCFYREGSKIGTGLCNRGTKNVPKGEKRLQDVKWTSNLQEWIPQTGDVYINQSSVKAYTPCCSAKYKRADGSVYTAFPVLAADEWNRICLALHPSPTE